MNRRRNNRQKLPIRKKLIFTGFVFLLALLPLAVLEVTLIVFYPDGETTAAEIEDPFIGLAGDQKLFEKTPDGELYQIRQQRLGYFRPASFLATKPANGFRVFVVGGSTVQGRPWETETAFPKFLELAISACEPQRSIEVINVGGVSYASYRLSHIVKEIVDYDPDLIILCSGHNEFLENRTYGIQSSGSNFVKSLHQFFNHSRTYQWTRNRVFALRSNKAEMPILEDQVITRLDYESGLELFTPKSLQRETVRQHFQFNLEKMLDTVLQQDTMMMVLAPPSNQKDCFPFKPTADWNPDSISPFVEYSLEQFDPDLEKDRSADFYYFRGQKNLQAGNFENARRDFDAAIDRDICPLRMTSPLRTIVAQVVERAQKKFGHDNLVFLDLQRLFQEVSPNFILGERLLVDHVHPSIPGHQKIATAILEQLQDRQLIARPEDWQIQYMASSTVHLDSLGFGYFQRGRDRLASVLRWSRGQADLPLKRNVPIGKKSASTDDAKTPNP